MKTLKEYSKLIKENIDHPSNLSKLELEISADYAYLASLLKPINDQKAEKWIQIKESEEKRLSDKLTEMKWRCTEAGKIERAYKLKIRSFEKMLTAIRSNIYISNMEAKNKY